MRAQWLVALAFFAFAPAQAVEKAAPLAIGAAIKAFRAVFKP